MIPKRHHHCCRNHISDNNWFLLLLNYSLGIIIKDFVQQSQAKEMVKRKSFLSPKREKWMQKVWKLHMYRNMVHTTETTAFICGTGMNLHVKSLTSSMCRCGCGRSREEVKFHDFGRAVYLFYFYIYMYKNPACKKHLKQQDSEFFDYLWNQKR